MSGKAPRHRSHRSAGMRVEVQRSSSARAANGVITHADGRRVAVLFLRAGDLEAMSALEYVYRLHGAPRIALTERISVVREVAGDCQIHDDGVKVTLRGATSSVGRSMLGLELVTPWGETSPLWEEVALEERSVWAGLLAEHDYTRICAANPAPGEEMPGSSIHLTTVPPMPVLKLTPLRGTRLSDGW